MEDCIDLKLYTIDDLCDRVDDMPTVTVRQTVFTWQKWLAFLDDTENTPAADPKDEEGAFVRAALDQAKEDPATLYARAIVAMVPPYEVDTLAYVLAAMYCVWYIRRHPQNKETTDGE